MQITLLGDDAIRVADAANMMPSVNGYEDRPGWRPVAVYKAKPYAIRDPRLVRLRTDSRVVIEKMLKIGLPADASAAAIRLTNSYIRATDHTRAIVDLVLDATTRDPAEVRKPG